MPLSTEASFLISHLWEIRYKGTMAQSHLP